MTSLGGSKTSQHPLRPCPCSCLLDAIPIPWLVVLRVTNAMVYFCNKTLAPYSMRGPGFSPQHRQQPQQGSGKIDLKYKRGRKGAPARALTAQCQGPWFKPQPHLQGQLQGRGSGGAGLRGPSTPPPLNFCLYSISNQ